MCAFQQPSIHAHILPLCVIHVCTPQVRATGAIMRGIQQHPAMPSSCRLQVTIGSEDLKANHMIQQIFEFPQEFEKYNLLVRRTEVFGC